jgi:hypothetical protein
MYGSFLNFSSVTLPGVGGQINASNAITTDQLAKMNKSGKKWSPDASGGMSHHNESILEMNAKSREKRANLVNRSYNENTSGEMAMKEIMDRKKSRMAAFKELKRKEYNFSDDELMAIPQPFASSEKCKCGSCPGCIQAKHNEREFREWSTEKRKEMKGGKFEGEFAGPNMSFPIASPADVSAAWSSVGRAPNPRQVMSNIIKIAKKHGWEEGLPASVKQRLSEGESGLPG